jgi:conjugative relaxase-like TrwC/TraI family protein
MRNFTPVKAGSGGTGDYAEYLLKEEALKKSSEYYVEGEKTATTSVYIGSKSAKLGLSGEISLEAAKELLAGYLPDGTRIRRKKTSGEEILAHDNTLSAPKSVSIQCVEDMRLLDCHITAVQQTIAALEKHYCVQRVQTNGIRTLEKGDGFVGWMTHHWTSRETEIDLHTHVITMNGCMGPDGKWRAIEDHQMSKALWIGSIYRNYLGQQVQGIGYKIREKKIEGKGYSFELEGYTDRDIEEFSTRHKQISEAKKKGLGDREAWYTTRKGKEEEISLGELFEKTIAGKAEIGCTGQSFPTSMNLRPIGKTDATAIVNNAIAHLSRGSCRFSQADILAQVFDHIERVKLKDVEQEIATHPELVDYGVIRGIDELKGQYTTATTLERETRIIKRWMRGQGQATPIMDKVTSAEAIASLETIYKVEWQQSHDLKLHEIRAKIADGDTSKRTTKKLQRLEKEEFKGLNKGQLGAVQGILATHNNHAIVYGLSGVGKTKSLRPTKDILDELGIDSLWLAPSLAAAAVLSADVGQEAHTLQRLAYTDSIKVQPGQLVFVDESGLADALTFDLAAAKIEAAGGRLILIGDHKQNQPIQAGSPMRSLMDHGAEVFKISEILRQQDPIQKRAVELIAEGKGIESLALLSEHGYLTEIQDPEQRQDAIATQYLSMPVPDQKNTLLITGTNAERLALTEKVRQGQKDAGILDKSLDCTQLEDSRLSPEQLSDLRNYAIGDYVAPVRDYAKVKRHEFCKVIGKTEAHLILESPNGSTFELEPDRWDKKLYTAGTINVAVGDELRLRGNIHGKDFQNGQVFTVKEIEGTIATLQGQKGNTRTIDLSRPVPIDHNIVRTAYDVQGSGKEGAILSLTDDRTSNQGSTYVGISRQFLFLTIYTQNYDALLKRVAREATHDNALDLLELFDYGSRTRDSATTQTTHNPDSGTTGAKQGSENTAQQRHEHSTARSQRRDAGVHSSVQGGTRQSKTVRDGRVHQTSGQGNGSPGSQNRQLGANSRTGGLISGDGSRGNQGLQESSAQQRFNETTDTPDLENTLSSAPQYFGIDDLAQTDRILQDGQSLVDVQIIDRLEQLMERLEQAASQPKTPTYEGMKDLVQSDRAKSEESMLPDISVLERLESLNQRLNASLPSPQAETQAYEDMGEHVQLTQLEPDERLLMENRVIERLEHLAQRLDDAQTDTPAQPYQGLGELIAMEDHDTDVRHILESRIIDRLENVINQLEAKTGAHHDPINSHSPSTRANENTQQIGEQYVGQNSRSESLEYSTRRDSRVKHDGRESGTRPRRLDLHASPGTHEQARWVARRNREPSEELGYKLERGQERPVLAARKNREAGRAEYGRSKAANDFTGGIGSEGGHVDSLQRIADTILRIRLQRELAEPMARLMTQLDDLAKITKSNQEKQASISAKLEQYLSQAKVEVLDTTLKEWRSLRQEANPIQLTDLEIAPSEVAQLTELLENYPAQKAIQYAMEEYSYASNQVIDLDASLKTGTPVFRLDELLAGSLSNKSKEVDRPVTQTIDRPQKQRPVTVEELKNIRALTRPEKPTQRVKQPQSKISKPIKAEAPFWTPDYSTAKRPDFIEPHHWEEFKQSAIHPEIIATRFKSVEDMGVYERLLSDKFMTMGAGQEITKPMQKKMDEFAQVAEGAWWYKAGKKVLDFPNLAVGQNPAVSTGGSLKPDPDNRREDTKKTNRKRERDPNAPTEFIKYENPLGPKKNLFERDLFFSDVPEAIAQRIYEKYNVTPTPQERAAGFWYVVYKHTEIPIYRIEGGKKDAALTSQGRAVIGGSGVNAGYRAYDLKENKLERRLLHPQLEIFAQPGREFRFANDQDTTVSAILNVRRDTVREAELLEEHGSKTLNIKWDGSGDRKGVDDLIAKDGPLAFEKADRNAYPMQREANIHYRTQYNALANEVKKEQPDISPEYLDVEVYLRAIAKGELKDGDRVLSQSDRARSLKDPNLVNTYIEQVKAAVPAYVQQQRELAKAKAAERAAKRVTRKVVEPQTAPETKESRDRKYRDIYHKIADEIATRFEPIEPKHLNAAVYQIAKAQGLDGDAIIRHSPDVRGLNDEMAKKYLKRNAQLAKRLVLEPKATKSKVVAKVRKDVQKHRELAAVQTQQAIAQATPTTEKQPLGENYREIYNKIADELDTKFEPVGQQRFNAAVYKIAQERGLDCDAIIRQSPVVSGLEGRLADQYMKRSATLAKRLVLEPKAVKTDKKIADNAQKPKVQNMKLDRVKKQDRGISR